MEPISTALAELQFRRDGEAPLPVFSTSPDERFNYKLLLAVRGIYFGRIVGRRSSRIDILQKAPPREVGQCRERD
jgi:hypothetical protein